MSLDPLHEWVARIVFDLPEAGNVAIAGGNAMLAHDLVVRPTQDLDLFTPVASEVDPLVAALTEALRGQGARVEVDRRGPGFSRLTVETVDGRQVVVEIAHDARLRDSVQLDFGRVLHPDEVAADKTLALFGRAAARDLVDVAALTDRYPLQELCALAEEKDSGFDASVLADAMNAAAAHPNHAFAELGLSDEATSRLRNKAQGWRTDLLATNTRRMPASVLEAADIDWVVEVLKRRRDPLVELAPVFWRPAADASASHREFIEYLLTEAGAHGFRTDEAVLVAAPRGEGWLVDDMYVPGSAWGSTHGGALWNALDRVAHGAPVRFVCPVYEESRAAFAQAAGLTIAESWWLLELPNGPSGGEPGVRVDLAGTEALTVAAPPVYDPGGPVLYIPALGDARTDLPAALESARDLGCPAIVVNQVAGDASLVQALDEAGFRRHCDYYTGIISPLKL